MNEVIREDNQSQCITNVDNHKKLLGSNVPLKHRYRVNLIELLGRKRKIKFVKEILFEQFLLLEKNAQNLRRNVLSFGVYFKQGSGQRNIFDLLKNNIHVYKKSIQRLLGSSCDSSFVVNRKKSILNVLKDEVVQDKAENIVKESVQQNVNIEQSCWEKCSEPGKHFVHQNKHKNNQTIHNP